MATAVPRDARPEGRVPPHDLDAEQSVLGAILQDPEAITRVLDFLNPEDFYRENHAQIFRACTRLFQDGEPIDNVTVTDALDKLGVLERVGGRAGLLLLQETVPTAANIEYYGRIVKERSYKRRLIHAGGTVAQLGYDPSVEAEDALSQAQAAVYGIAEDRIKQDFERLYDLLRPAMDRIDAQMASGKGVVGIPSGFTDLDRLTSGFKAGELVIVAGRPGIGKALALDTPIPTPGGWRTMADLRVGDQVFDEQGNPCTVTRATEVLRDRRCYRVVFSDGEAVVADAEHLWATTDRGGREAGDHRLGVRTTEEIVRTLRTPDGRARHAVPAAGRLRYPERRLPVDPYVLGAWLGSGHQSSATIAVADADRQILEEIRAAGVEVTPLRPGGGPTPRYRLGGGCEGARVVPFPTRDRQKVAATREAVQAGQSQRWPAAPHGVSPATARLLEEPAASLQAQLRQLGVIGSKHVPRPYLESSPTQRLALLQGLLDTDGQVSELGYAEFSTTSARLAADVKELATGLGLIARLRRDRTRPPGVDLGSRHRVGFRTDQPVFRLRRKLSRLPAVAATRPGKSRRIVDVVATDSVPVRCIQVDSPSHLYLAGRGCIPTHNTSWCLNVILEIATQFKVPVAMFSLEMSKDQLVERLLCEHARIDAQRMHRGQLSDAEYDRLAQSLGPLSEAPIFIDDAPTLDELTVLLKSRQIHLREKVGMIVIDYLQLMHGRSRGDDANRVQEVSAISRALKMVARELSVPVVAISQLSRAVEQRTDKRPMLSDLRESGCLSGDTPIYLPETGRRRPLRELAGTQGFQVLALDPHTWRLERARVTNAFATGTKQVFRLRTSLGRVVRATANHRFLTRPGWRRLDELAAGDRIALPRLPAAGPNPALPSLELARRDVDTGSSWGGPGRTATALASPDVEPPSQSEVCWDAIASIEPDREEEVFDLTVERLHNFVAGDVIVHNSIEQDSDQVIFLYRDDYYKDDVRPGIAEVILAKNRNGPTGKAELKFVKEQTRFYNLEARRPEPAQ